MYSFFTFKFYLICLLNLFHLSLMTCFSLLATILIHPMKLKYSVSVSAVDDDLVEGAHYTTILHTVRNIETGEEILLTDESPLYAKNVLVTIYDDDTPGKSHVGIRTGYNFQFAELFVYFASELLQVSSLKRVMV